ncbi:hypothetical protein AMTR_s00026p00231340 [Amborella trichopoda]|uniref:Uncharacterized protein n=1 Tax=Amborella trichopoda TaxID=13333 RepID=W1PRV9_AMBTC|nr:hypothetical protein AMTR_s00026p00231340 [Amborella trichopoda]
MSTSYDCGCKELLGIPFDKIRGRHDSEIHLGKLRWEFIGVAHLARRMMGGRAPQGESSYPSSRGVARSSGDEEGVGCDIPNLGDGSTFFDEDAVPPQTSLTDEEWREQERERIRDAHEQAMIEDEQEVFPEEIMVLFQIVRYIPCRPSFHTFSGSFYLWDKPICQLFGR